MEPNFQNKLSAINSSIFNEGMQINAGIYYKYRNRYVLICKNVMLTKELIKKIRLFSSEQRTIYVEKESYQNVLTEGIRYCRAMGITLVNALGEPIKEQELEMAIKAEESYQSISADTELVLDQIAETNKIPMELTDKIIDDLNARLMSLQDSTLMQCINTIREGDQYLYSHCVDVAILNGLIGRWLKLSEEDIALLIKIGYLHDVGKIRVPPEILNKPGPLTDEEYIIIKRHAPDSYDILKNSGEEDIRILEGVREHHERVNGTGYPDGVPIKAIPLFARITAVSDVYSAMVSRRVYKPQQSPFDILKAFSLDRFSDLDFKIVNVFLENMPREFVGKYVLLSNGEIAQVVHVPAGDLSHPIVKTKQGQLVTNDDISCVSMSNPVSIFTETSQT